jgi:maleate isomerase
VHGWRGRCGLILPADNTVTEPELYGLGLEGLSFHFARLTSTDRALMPGQGVALAGVFREMGVDALAYACAETSFLNGVDANQALIAELEAAAGMPAITATAAMVLALRHLGAKTIALVTPYTALRGDVMEGYLRTVGFEILASHHQDFHAGSSGLREWYETNLQVPAVAYRLARALVAVRADAILISATNLRTAEMIPVLERDAGRPVVTSNGALAWWFARQLGVSLRGSGLGRLLDE